MTLGPVPLCCSPGHISAIFRQQTIFPSEWSMAISMRSYRSWSQLFHRSILSFSFRSLPCLPIPLRIKLQLELDVLQINNYLSHLPLFSLQCCFYLDSIGFYSACSEYQPPTSLLFPLEFPPVRT